MVNQCVNLYENNVAHGTLFVSVDDSKFLIKFYESIKVEVLLDDVSNSESNGTTTLKDSEEFGKWGDYLDLSQLSSDQKIPVTSQKIVKAEDGQYLTITTLDPALVPENKVSQPIVDERSESFCEIISDVNNDTRRSKKRKIASVIENENGDGQKVSSNTSVKNEMDNRLQNSESPDNLFKMDDSSSLYLSHNLSDILSVKETASDNSNKATRSSGSKRNAPSIHSCRDCFATFDTFQALKDHRKTKSSNEYRCDECSELFEYQAFLDVHKKSNHGSAGASLVYKDNQYWYSCDTCGTLVKTILHLQIHNLAHTGEGIFQCCRCPEKFGEKRELRLHMKNHKLSGMIRCRWCNKWFADKGALAKHKLKCKEIKCHLCDNVFPNKTSRNQHYKDFHPNDILKCELCSYMFSSQGELDDHIVKHSKSKKKQCTLCGLFFSRLKKHMLIHKNPEEYAENEIFYCDKCPAKFTNQATFSRHRKNHLGDKPYQCPNCPRTFANCGVLYKHIKRHKSLLPYTCEVCGESCASIDELKSHIKTHSNDNLLFPCSVCAQTFMYKNSLEAHMQMKHSQPFATTCGANSAAESAEIVKATHDYSSSFSTTTNALMEVVIPGISGQFNSQVQKYEVVILQE